MNYYNFDFDIASIIIFLIVIFSYFQKKHVDQYQHKLFLSLFAAAILTPIADIPAAILIENKADWLLTMSVNTIYYLSKQLTTFLFLSYVSSQIKVFSSIPARIKIIALIPLMVVVLLIITNPLTGLIFSYSYNGRNYQTGPLRLLSYAVYIFYLIWTILFVLTNKKDVSRAFYILVPFISGIIIVMEIIQFIKPDLLLHSLAFSISMLLLLLNIEKYGMVVDAASGMGKREHLNHNLTKMINARTPFHVAIIKIADFEINTFNYGVEAVESQFKEIGSRLLTYVQPEHAFKISNDTAVLIFDYSVGIQALLPMIYDELKKPVQVNDTKIYGEFFLTAISYPENLKSVDSFMVYFNHFIKLQRVQYGIIPFSEIKVKDKSRERAVEKAVEDGFQNDNFEVFYQPICTAKDKRFITAEALLRLKDPELGYISPEEFIPIAEKNGSILKIGKFVLTSVCHFIATHDMKELGLEYIELNLSTVQCLQQDFIESIEHITELYNIDSKYLCFEITETSSNAAPAIFAENLDKLNKRGFILALDDFGTGYGNLQRMVNSDFKLIKFDKQMTQQLSSGSQLKKVYKTLQAMISTMGSNVVSEGIETKEQYEFVRDAGCKYIQGFYFSKPLPAPEFCRFLLENKNRTLE